MTALVDAYEQAARALSQATALVITAGAGMGVDSGLPDFRGPEGFWRAYPAFRKLGLSFVQLANPQWFHRDPALAWGFYGHRLALYRETTPHSGFAILRSWAQRLPTFVLTSNVDGAFQRAGFAESSLYECHGSIHWLQALDDVAGPIFDATPYVVDIDADTCRACGELPRAPTTKALLRPNILMFNDWGWNQARSARQAQAYAAFLRQVDLERVVVVECGAGVAIPTVRREGENLVRLAGSDATLVRINPQASEASVSTGCGISLVDRAQTALVNLARLWNDRG